jgi:hypothetical protein
LGKKRGTDARQSEAEDGFFHEIGELLGFGT